MDDERPHAVPHPSNSWVDHPPTNSLPYQYHPLAESEIRLLALLPGKEEDPVWFRLDHAFLSDKPKFETISYAWGDPNIRSTIECEGRTIQITLNLHTALRYLRHETDERIIWADAVCINQQDLDERSVQVTLMGVIYAVSHQVSVWLGEETEDTRDSIEQFKLLDTYFTENEVGYRTDPDRWNINPLGGSPNYSTLVGNRKDWEVPISNIGRIPWFVRRWVLQEVAKSPSAIVVLGKKQIPWVTIAEVIWSLHKNGLLAGFAHLENAVDVLDGIQSILMIELVRRDVIRENGSKLVEMIVSTRRYRCMDRRDVIYSQLGIIKDLDTFNQEAPPGSDTKTVDLYKKLTLSPDYTASTEEIYHRFVLTCIIKKKTLLTLSATYIRPENPVLNLPSWVPDFSDLYMANSLMHLRNEAALPYKASKGSEVEVRFSNDYKILHVKGRVIDEISEVAPSQQNTVLTPEWEELSKTENWDEQTIAKKVLRLWFRGGIKFYNPSAGEGKILGLTPEQFNIFSRVLVCNLTASGGTPSEDFPVMVHQYLDVMMDRVAGVNKWVKDPADLPAFIDRLLLVEGAIGLKAAGWCFGMTEQGRMGRMLENVRKGDKVVLFNGGEVPYVIRKRDEGGWTFITSCYLYGMMDGEGMVLDGVVDEEFDLY